MKTSQTEKKNVVFSFLGIEKDQPGSKFRPTIELCQKDNLKIDTLCLFYNKEHLSFGESLKTELETLNRKISIKLTHLERNAFDLESTFETLKDFFNEYTFKHDSENYYLHIGTGTHIEHICFFIFAKQTPLILLQNIPPNETGNLVNEIKLNLERYAFVNKPIFIDRQKERQWKLKQGIETKNPAFNKLIEEIEDIAAISIEPILLTGPTGAGKTKLANQIAQLNENSKFIAVNCATLTGDLAKSSLFGYKKGAFTGAIDDYDGYLKQADGGTLFLDEIGELSLETQAMLLKAIEEKEFYPLGSKKLENSNFRLICGTNRNLEDEVKKGTFRKDLLERINVWPYRLPGLAERREDIDPNINHELKELNKSNPNNFINFTTEAREYFLRYALDENTRWEGNFREFHKMFIRMATYAQKEKGNITLEIVKQEITRTTKDAYSPPVIHPPKKINLKELLGEAYSEYGSLDLKQLEYIIAICKSAKTQTEAGRLLFKKGLTNYSDQTTKILQKFNLKWNNIKSI